MELRSLEEAVARGFTITDFDRYEAARTAVDITAAYTFPARKFKILAQARNLTNAPEQEYRGNQPLRPPPVVRSILLPGLFS